MQHLFTFFQQLNLFIHRLMLQGLSVDSEYEITEPIPNNIMQNTGNFLIIESDSKFLCQKYNNIYLTQFDMQVQSIN